MRFRFSHTFLGVVILACLGRELPAQTQIAPGSNQRKTQSQQPMEKPMEPNGSKAEDEKGEDEGVSALRSKAKTVKIGGIEWFVDYDTALKIANEEQKLMWLHFGENPG